MTVESELLDRLNGHHIATVAQMLGWYLGTGCDCVSLLVFLCLVGGRLRQPIHVVISSEDQGAEYHIAARILRLSSEQVRHITNKHELRNLAKSGFEATDVVVLYSDDEALARYAFQVSCEITEDSPYRPSFLRIVDKGPKKPCLGPTFSINASSCERSLSGFGHHFSDVVPIASSNRDGVSAAGYLVHLLSLLVPLQRADCRFLNDIRAGLRPEESLAFHRLLRSVAAVREPESRPTLEISVNDYEVARSLVTALPIVPLHSVAVPHALRTAEQVFESVNEPGYQKTLPDGSDLGRKLFDRRQVCEWTGLSYNAAKDHLSHLEKEGVVEATREKDHRGRGKQTYYRFRNGLSPPFSKTNPFDALPRLRVAQISTENANPDGSDT